MSLAQESLLFFTLLQLSIIVLAGRLGGWAAQQLGQSAAVGEIVIGILLGPSLFGWIAPGTFDYVFRSAPSAPLQILSSLGLVLLMFQIGLEFEFRHLRERANRTAVLSVAATCQLAPFVLGLLFGYYSAPWLAPAANRLHCALFIATAFSITALPTLGRMMIELGITRCALAVVAISAAAINDVVGWLHLALITAITAGEFHGAGYGLRVALVAAYALICLLVIRPVVKRLVRRSNPREGALSGNLVGGLLVLVFVSAIATYQLGIFAIFGGFMMGVILFDETEMVAAWRASIGQFVNVFFLPIFFTYTGLRTSIGSLRTLQDWEWCAVLLALATLGKLGGAYLAARLAGRTHPEAAALGYMMNTRALMELVVVNVGFDLGVISPQMFTMLVIMAILSTLITVPALRRYLPRAGSLGILRSMLMPRLGKSWCAGSLLAAMLVLCPLRAGCANKPPHPGTLLGSHPSEPANKARLAFLKQRSKSVPLTRPKPGKIANSLNTHPGKIITINRKLPK